MPSFKALVEDFEASYNALPVPWHVLQEDDGIQRSDEPVSKSMKKVRGGVPTVILPAHSESSSRSVSGTFWRFPSRLLGSVAIAGILMTPEGSCPVLRWPLMIFPRILLER